MKNSKLKSILLATTFLTTVHTSIMHAGIMQSGLDGLAAMLPEGTNTQDFMRMAFHALWKTEFYAISGKIQSLWKTGEQAQDHFKNKQLGLSELIQILKDTQQTIRESILVPSATLANTIEKAEPGSCYHQLACAMRVLAQETNTHIDRFLAVLQADRGVKKYNVVTFLNQLEQPMEVLKKSIPNIISTLSTMKNSIQAIDPTFDTVQINEAQQAIKKLACAVQSGDTQQQYKQVDQWYPHIKTLLQK